ncbi:hypothetical protein ACT7DH_05375 [Bacillus pacificus]
MIFKEALLLGQRIGVNDLQGPSSKIEKIYDIPLPYQRTFTDKEFNYYYQIDPIAL